MTSTKTIGNTLDFKTYSWLKVNNTEIVIPEMEGQGPDLASSEARLDGVFEGADYGLSPEVLKLNKERGNLYLAHQAKEGAYEKTLDLEATDQAPLIVDTQDVLARKGQSLKLNLAYRSSGKKAKLRSSLIRIKAEKESQVDIYIGSLDGAEVQILESIYLDLDESAKVRLFLYQLGGSVYHSNVRAHLRGDSSDLEMDAIYFGRGSDKLDLHYDIYHHGALSKSDLMVNGALKDQAYKKFTSNLDFKPGSKKASGSEEEYAILLSDDVKALSVPILLSGEDDVAGNHAASAGQLDREKLFYIMSRGLDRAQAETLVINSRFAHAIEALEEEAYKEEVWARISEMLA